MWIIWLILFCEITKCRNSEISLNLIFEEIKKNEKKVAAIGLKRSHLGQRLANVRSHLEKLKNQFGVHPAGEGACSRSSTFS